MLFSTLDNRYVIDPNISTADIKQYFRPVSDKPFPLSSHEVSLFEFGIDKHRFDLIKINCYTRKIRIFEFKMSRNDFLSDKKWTKYLSYCHTLTFVCPIGIINKNELPKGIGLLNVFCWYYKHYPKKQKLGGMWIRKPRSTSTPTNKILTHIVFTAVSKFPYRNYWK